MSRPPARKSQAARRVPARVRPVVAWTFLVLCGGCTGVATSLGGRPGPEAGLLRGKLPVKSSRVTHVDRLTDGIASAPGDPPRTELTSVLASTEAFAVYDLGREAHVGCAAVLADADDSYVVSMSRDGTTYVPVWTAAAIDDHGMQPRAARGLGGVGRWLRLTATGGDGFYSVSELSVAEICPPRWPPPLALQAGTPIEQSLQLKLWAFAGFGAAFLLGYRRRSPDFIKLLVAVPVGVGLAAAVQLADLWPPPSTVIGPLALAVGSVAAASAIRITIGRLWTRRRRSLRRKG